MAGNTKNQQKYFLQIYWIMNYAGLNFNDPVNTLMLNMRIKKDMAILPASAFFFYYFKNNICLNQIIVIKIIISSKNWNQKLPGICIAESLYEKLTRGSNA